MRTIAASLLVLSLAAGGAIAAPGAADSPASPPIAPVIRPPSPVAPVDGVGMREHLGTHLPRGLAFKDQLGREVRLGDLFQDDLPIILILYYDRCPMLCGLVLHGVVDALKADGGLGKRFRAITVSIDPRETPDEALSRQRLTLERAGAVGGGQAWPFLTGRDEAIRALARSVGFTYRFDPATGQYAHPAVIMVLSPRGQVARYLYGVRFEASEIRQALEEASRGRTGETVDKFLLGCYREDLVVRRDAPAVRRDAPAVRRDAPAVRRDAPAVRRDAPAVRRDAPVNARRDEAAGSRLLGTSGCLVSAAIATLLVGIARSRSRARRRT